MTMMATLAAGGRSTIGVPDPDPRLEGGSATTWSGGWVGPSEARAIAPDGALDGIAEAVTADGAEVAASTARLAATVGAGAAFGDGLA